MIDGYNLGMEKGTGIATYARNLSFALRDLGYGVSVLYGKRSAASRDELLREIGFFEGDTDRSPARESVDRVVHALRGPLSRSAVEVPMTGRVISASFAGRMPHYDKIYNAVNVFHRSQSAFKLWGRLSDVAVPQRPDLAHWTYPLPLRVKGVPNIYTLHDLVPLRLPHTTSDNKRLYLRLIRQLKDRADHIVTVSECSKRDIVEITGISPSRVTNTYQSVDIPLALRNKSEEVVAREVEAILGVDYKNYYLFWGSLEPKKNIGRMVQAYIASGSTARLVIIGARAWKAEEETRFLGAEGIINLSYVPFELLVSLIRGAKAALFPSLYEGFGLPMLEAMLLGTPVICSDSSSLPEVAGDAAVMVDPYDTPALAEAIRRVDADAGLRDAMRERGVLQAARFTPKLYRDRLQAVYQGLM
ncbi:glycosyltransferase [Altererythrobacter xixiisoli]|uniref:Glycosyltransferase n=1 Tax=Croceibacterium xixiisoli TaxID=1476466 RepID=A0A6I4TST2_9SPHN|nr:glycosyltransferase family 1 protein [Croceibacterium xixiisoli]MXO99205.1 glycosyltransferase [Croceibacterium xixiisoli]